MIEATTIKKNKISLSDYNYQRDIENRLLMSQFKEFDVAVLEEILFSPIKVPVRKLAKNLDASEDQLLPVLQTLSQTGLLSFEDDAIVVDKDARKYFETEIEKFEEGFIPGMEFLHNMLKKIPIHVLPVWYAIPRTSNNIFQSLLEKYLHTPQIFQRYLLEVNFGSPVISAIAQEVFLSPELEVSSKEIEKKFEITHEQFQEYMLILELHFVCCLKYHKKGDKWEALATPFQEWREYLQFLKVTTPKSLNDEKSIQRLRPNDFSFVEDLATILQMAMKEPISLDVSGKSAIAAKLPQMNLGIDYVDKLVQKLQMIQLVEVSQKKLKVTEAATEWLEMRLENRALYLYRHPTNRLLSEPEISEKVIRDIEKSVHRVLHSGWIYFEDFIRGVFVPFGDHEPVGLKKQGRHWKYARPDYTEKEIGLIHDVIFEWLFETGITAIATCNGKECFTVTAFGQSLYG